MIRFNYPCPWDSEFKEIWLKLCFSLLAFPALVIMGLFVVNTDFLKNKFEMVLAKQLLFQLQLSDLLYSGLISVQAKILLYHFLHMSDTPFTIKIPTNAPCSPFSQLLAATEPQRLTSTLDSREGQKPVIILYAWETVFTPLKCAFLSVCEFCRVYRELAWLSSFSLKPSFSCQAPRPGPSCFS